MSATRPLVHPKVCTPGLCLGCRIWFVIFAHQLPDQVKLAASAAYPITTTQGSAQVDDGGGGPWQISEDAWQLAGCAPMHVGRRAAC